MVNFNLGKSIGKMTEKAKKKSEEMSGKAGEQSTKIAEKLEEPITALKSSVVVTKLVEKITNEGAESAAECLKEVRPSRRVHLGVGGTCIEFSTFFSGLLPFWIAFHQFRSSTHWVLGPWFQDQSWTRPKIFAVTYTLALW